MYARIMTPVDLSHANRLGKALKTAADLAKHYKIPVCYAGVTSPAPSSVAHNPKEYAQKLAEFAAEQGRMHGIETTSRAIVSHDPSVDVDDALMDAIKETGTDLVVMASHIPNLQDYIWPSNGGKIASHSAASVMVVRDV